MVEYAHQSDEIEPTSALGGFAEPLERAFEVMLVQQIGLCQAPAARRTAGRAERVPRMLE